jgi:hypothetical protein
MTKTRLYLILAGSSLAIAAYAFGDAETAREIITVLLASVGM